ncbi:hypothetical protein G4A34_29710 [Escherichia coli]|nr:hypothetical protein [Escherichia coli]
MKTGTFNQFIRGGIAFATPPGTPLAPKAQEGKHFLLQEVFAFLGFRCQWRTRWRSGDHTPEFQSQFRVSFVFLCVQNNYSF